MRAFPALILLAVLLPAGCRAAVTNESAPSRPGDWEEMHLVYARRLQRWRWGGGEATVDQPPPDAVRVPVTVDSVSVPHRVSTSTTPETATVTFSVRAGYIPFAPKCTRVVMTFQAIVNPFMDGAVHELVFLPDGRFWGGGSFHF
jgi:hypothetical protein